MAERQKHRVQIGGKTYSAEFQTAVDYVEAWQRVLFRAYEEHAVAYCQCNGTGTRAIYLRRQGVQYILARYPDTGPEHARDCHYFSDEADLAPEGVESETPRIETTIDEASVHIAIGLRVKPTLQPGRTAPSNQRRALSRNAPAPPVCSLDALLHLLWDRAKLNEWKPEWIGKRSLFSINRRLRDAAIGVSVNGATLKEHLLVGAIKNDQEGRDHNGIVMALAKEKPRRLLVLAKMALATPQVEAGLNELRLANFWGIPRLYVARKVVDEMKPATTTRLLSWKAGQNTAVLAHIEAVPEKSYWRVVDLAFMSISMDYVALPGERSYL